MTDITIPPEALEAAAFHLPGYHNKDLWPHVEAACLAMIKNWPGMGPIRTDQPIGDWCDKLPAIILPLSENTND